MSGGSELEVELPDWLTSLGTATMAPYPPAPAPPTVVMDMNVTLLHMLKSIIGSHCC